MNQLRYITQYAGAAGMLLPIKKSLQRTNPQRSILKRPLTVYVSGILYFKLNGITAFNKITKLKLLLLYMYFIYTRFLCYNYFVWGFFLFVLLLLFVLTIRNVSLDALSIDVFSEVRVQNMAL